MEPSDDGPKLTYNTANKTFSFYPQFDEARYFGTKEESVTHRYCIEEISKLGKITIKSNNDFATRMGGNLITFSYKYCFPEIILQIGDNYIKPDILLYLRGPSDLALRWNRLLAVEVVVSHDLNGEKLKLMEKAKIPVLRIKANKKWGRKKEDEMSDKEKHDLRNWIKNTFKKKYTGDFLLDPKSKALLENKTIQMLELEKTEMAVQGNTYQKQIQELEVRNKKLKERNQELLLGVQKQQTAFENQARKVNSLEVENKRTTKKAKSMKKTYSYALIVLLVVALTETMIILFR